MSSMALTTTNVGGVDVIDLSSPSSSSGEADAVQNAPLDLFQLILETSRNNRNAANTNVPPWPTSYSATIQNARTAFRRIAMLALAEMGKVCQVMSTIPMGLAKSLVNYRVLYLINGYIRMINAHEPFVDGELVWTIRDSRNAVYVIGQVHRGFHYLLLTAEKIASTPNHQLGKLGEYLHKKYLAIYGDKLEIQRA